MVEYTHIYISLHVADGSKAGGRDANLRRAQALLGIIQEHVASFGESSCTRFGTATNTCHRKE